MTPAASTPTPAPFDPRARLAAFLRDAAAALAHAESDTAICGREFHLTIARGCIAGAQDCAAMISERENTLCAAV